MKEKVFYEKTVKHYEGLGLRDGSNCIVKLTNFNLQLCDVKKRTIKSIALKDISNVAIISDTELVQKDKSVIKRGLVGGVLFGGVGLFLGALDGTGSKTKEQNIDYLIINYKDNGEDKVINVYANSGIIDNTFMNALNYAIDMSKSDLKCPKCGKEYNFNEYKCKNCGTVLKDTKKLKVFIGILVGVVAFFILIAIIGMSIGSGTPKEVNIIKRVISVETEKAENINNVLKEVGLNNFEDIKADSESLDGFEGEGSKGYRIKTDFIDNVILYLDSDNNIICIRYADKDYYRDGKVTNKFESNN
ncbi:MAG: hypothetical protein KH135_00785 [Firmicutes bacterium]|nr:hypothetical protein [Bacillota bacterium]